MSGRRRRPSACLVLVLLAASVLGGLWPSPGAADVSYIPIPSFATSRNEGNDAGFIVPVLVTEPDGELKYIIAPMFIVNSIVGARGTINLFRYEPGGRELRFIASYTEEIERKLVFSYTDPAFRHGRYALQFGASFFKNATSRFWGIGIDTPENNETNYTSREVRVNWRFGVHLNEVTQVAVGQRYREVRVQQGATDLPFSAAVFPQVVGMEGAAIFGHRATFYYDTRDHLVTPTDGLQAIAYAEVNHNIRNGDHPLYYRYGLEFRKLIPSASKKAILIIRGDLQTTFGNEVPFYEQSSLGGPNNLRGFGLDRFIDNHLVAFNIEQRLHVLRTKILNVAADFEIAPFVDMGKVFSSFRSQRLFHEYEVTPGIGFRGLVRPNVVGRIDYGYSDEGGAVFAGLDFPF